MKKRLFAALTAAVMAFSAMPYALADDAMEEINDTYDEVMAENSCETETDGFTLTSGAPDGTSYLQSGDTATKICEIETDTYEDYMWEADVKFDAAGSGFTVYSKTAKSKVGTCLRRNDGSDGSTPQLAIQTGSSSYKYYCEIDPDAWYHVQLIGQHGTSKSLTMKVGKWENGEITYVGTYTDIPKRNNPPSSYILAEANTSLDNAKITKLGADELTVSTVPDGVTEINAGSGTQLTVSAYRKGLDINTPAYEWKAYEGDTEITDGSVAISSDGALTTTSDCGDKSVTVKAVSTEKGNVEGSYELSVKAVDLENEKYDTLSLSAENDYVRADEPLALTVTATKNGETVSLDDGDVVWAFYDENNIQEIGNKYITVEDNRLCVSDKVISQNITVRARNANKTVSASLPVRIKASDAAESDEDATMDKILAADACEDTSNTYLESGSWDGSHYYAITATYDMASVTNTTEDVIIETDLKFTDENSGIKLRDSANSKEGGQIARQGTSIGRIASGNKFTAYCTGDADSWYHVVINTRCGSDGYYGKAAIYKYDENGALVNPDTGAENEAVTFDLDLRTMYTKSFSHIQAQTGTGIDNMRILKLVPDSITISMSSDSVFAGQTIQAACTVSHKGTEVAQYPAVNVKWAIYDAENKYPVDDSLAELITVTNGLVSIDATASEQTVYVRAAIVGTEIYSSLPLTIKGSDIFEVTGIGINEAGDTVTELKVQKDYFYNGDVTFIVAAYNEKGELMGMSMKSLLDNTLSLGENKISLDLPLPDGFDSVEAFVWTSL